MNKKIILVSLSVLICVTLIGMGITYAVSEHSDFFRAGERYKELNGAEIQNAENEAQILAVYRDHKITKEVVDYQRDMYVLVNKDTTAADSTDKEIVDRLIKGILWGEEATRLGFSVTQDEIEAMVESAERAYSIPEGKEMLDEYLAGAGITLNEYLEILREQAPRTIARQKMKNEISRQYCEENGLTYTATNTTPEMLEAQDAYIEALFQQRKDEIIYYIETD